MILFSAYINSILLSSQHATRSILPIASYLHSHSPFQAIQLTQTLTKTSLKILPTIPPLNLAIEQIKVLCRGPNEQWDLVWIEAALISTCFPVAFKCITTLTITDSLLLRLRKVMYCKRWTPSTDLRLKFWSQIF